MALRVVAIGIAAIVAVFLGASGLFGLDVDIVQHELEHELQPKNVPRVFDRMVFVVIDALRADMVLGTESLKHQGGYEELNAFMPYTSHLASSSQCISYIGHAAVPTVTMPRLKALTTGKKPAFIDVIRNFNSKALDEDNLLTQFTRAGMKMVLYGDETWLQLFPTAFIRADPTSGFFTKDTVEVDTNVSRHLRDELDPTLVSPKSTDWDVLFLHYLGVDHIGHLTGPHSQLMRAKLLEMDATIETIHTAIVAQDAKQGSSTLLVLLSDHGMTETGNHGGASVEESSALLLFVLPEKITKRNTEPFERRPQVDLVPTLALLLGVPIPHHNTGKILSNVVHTTMTQQNELEALHQNILQLYQLAQPKHSPSFWRSFQQEHETSLTWTPAINMPPEIVRKRMLSTLEALQNIVMSSDGSEYNTLHMLLGILVSFLTLIVLCRVDEPIGMLFANRSPWTLAHGFWILLQLIALGSSSSIENEHVVWNFLFISLVMAIAIETLLSKQHQRWIPLLLIAFTARILRSRNQIINFGRLNNFEIATSGNRDGLEYEHDNSLSIISTRSLFDNFLSLPVERVLATLYIGVAELSSMSSRMDIVSFLVGLTGTVLYNFTEMDAVAHIVYLSCAVQFILAFQSLKSLPRVLWLLAYLLQRDTNIGALALIHLQTSTLNNSLLHEPTVSHLNGLIIFYVAKCSFFALGNSHLMTTIDISKAYTGLTMYSQIIVGSLTAVIVFTGPLVTSLSLLSSSRKKNHLLRQLWTYELTSYGVYSVIVYLMRFHLFIWSVFAPKMMYSIAWILYLLALSIVLTLVQNKLFKV